MNTFYFYDGQNEAGPFTLDELKRQRITRTTPLRLTDSNKWMPAERVTELKDFVAPRKIKRPKDIVPAVAEHLGHLHRRKPVALYGTLLGLGLLTSLSIFSLGRAAKEADDASAIAAAPISLQSTASQSAHEIPHPKMEEAKPAIAVATPKEDAAKAARQRWNKLISATNSNYGIGLLGGIKDLSVIVNNRSSYPLDEVVTKVTYIKASGEVWKTKLITMYAVPAGDSKEQSAPDVGRGKKVKVSLYKIVSRKMHFNYTEGERGKDANDPYFKEA